MIDLGSGELIQRLRRAFGIRGRVEVQLDHQLIPVAIGENLSQAPFRRSGARFFTSHQVVSIAAQFPAISFENLSLTSAMVLDRVVVASPVATRYQLGLQEAKTGVWGNARIARTFETFNLGANQLVPAQTQNASLGAALPVAETLVEFRLLANEPLVLPLDLVVPNRNANAQAMVFYIQGLTAASELAVSWSGRFWQDTDIRTDDR